MDLSALGGSTETCRLEYHSVFSNHSPQMVILFTFHLQIKVYTGLQYVNYFDFSNFEF